ncbi:glycosyltransferase family 4 protein [Wolinella succinogenes]|uniref:glycosyltransferase family 4 protein n=1 Tax=Wolinella succinogenes TaxID=844 RepID=UPI002FC6F67D
MKILFLTDNFFPEVNAPASRTYEHAKEWIVKGEEVTVITCAPNFPQGRVYDGYKNSLYSVEYIDGIKVIRVWSYITSNEGFFKRVLDYLSFAFTSFVAGLFVKTDVIVATSPQFFTAWSGCALSFFKRKPWIFELRDLWPESIRTVGAMKKEKVLDFLEKIELWLYKNSAKVVAVTAAFKANLIKRGIDADKIEIVTNGVNMELFAPVQKDDALAKKLGIEGKFVIGYIGTHGMAHSLDFIVRTISKIKDDRYHFLFIGDGAMKKEVLKIAEELSVKNATFLEPVLRSQIPLYISVTDAALVPLKKSDTFKTVIPSKIFENAAMQKPIFLGVDGQAREIVEAYGAGVYFEPENEQDFMEKLGVFEDKLAYENMQKACKRLAMDYNRKKLSLDMLKIMREVRNG